MSIYNEKNIFEFEGNRYERLFDHPDGQTWRIILSDDDYDYVEDQDLITKLEGHLKMSLRDIEFDGARVTYSSGCDDENPFVTLQVYYLELRKLTKFEGWSYDRCVEALTPVRDYLWGDTYFFDDLYVDIFTGYETVTVTWRNLSTK